MAWYGLARIGGALRGGAGQGEGGTSDNKVYQQWRTG